MRSDVGLLALSFLLAAAPVHAESEPPNDPAEDPENPTPAPLHPAPPPPRSSFELGVETVAAVRAVDADTSYATSAAQALFVFGITARWFVAPTVAVGLTGGYMLRDSGRRPFGEESGPLLLGTVAYYAPLGLHAFFVPTLQLGGYVGWKSGNNDVTIDTRGLMLRVGLGFAFPITDAIAFTVRPEIIWTHGFASTADDTADTPFSGFGPGPSAGPTSEPGATNDVHGAMSLGAAYRF